MAKFKPGQAGTIVGSIKNIEFFESKQGNLIRSKPVHFPKFSPGRDRVRARMSHVSKSWSHLTYAQIMAWHEFGITFTYKDKVGKSLQYTGWNMYNMCNTNLIEVNEVLISTPPEKIYPEFTEPIEAEIIPGSDGDDLKIKLKSPIPEFTKIIVSATGDLKSTIRSVNPHLHKKIAVIDHAFKSGSLLSNEYYNVIDHDFKIINSIELSFKAVSTISGLAVRLPNYRAFKNS